ncbi:MULTISPECIES: pyrroline-5-carboxylate reductase [Providencia]|uniref:Pyrroline-5-carboxylate reductase n=1 Tax=Providencia stuartii (strain MRSN 2154) TaxID=1157951 RepID=A0A140NH70_PROSM|nr:MULTISPECIES: pyrroline-5-carboxylate reductase [Providencia]AFH93084.1 pyrroline-5-carboxylate reductase [Providencia stuartii MRSN 2154]EMD1719014.1 pyrroline-5-carboxylate reductase [Providencia stuartii]EMD1719668.1 pyrroline-5-carboxylate reductase [Providencia stuartii]EMF0917236.1 pyrroline-5-carboxylate reductase [Providencia stuartii]KSX99106.1 pyrroline-5-carboxylate reductase [Providencia stuartii]
MQHRKIAFIGAGNMAHAIIAGLVSHGYPASMITVCSPTPVRREKIAEQYGVISSSDNVSAVQHADVIVLAVKPQMMEEVCQPLQHAVDFSKKLVLTIAAGIPAHRYADYLAQPLQLVRIMPNTPSLVGKGVSGLFAEESINAEDKQFAEQLMQSVGSTIWCENEQEINNIIAITGSSPAYFFLFMESMQQEAEKLGYTPDQARQLVLNAAEGAVALSKSQGDTPFSTLREQVTSKGGTTAMALAQFYDSGLPQMVAKAMQRAITRAEEMEKLF